MKRRTTNKMNICWTAVAVIGFVVFVLGTASQLRYLTIRENNDMLNGLLTGLGGALFFVSAVMLVRNALISPKKRREEEIGMRDERNIAVSRAAMSFAYVVATLLSAAMVVAFIWMKMTVPALIATGVSVAQVIVFLIAYIVLNKRY